MIEQLERLIDYKRDSEFYGSLDLIVTIKSFDLTEIRKRYIESKKNSNTKTGSIERRTPALGGVASVNIHRGEITNKVILSTLKEPRGIDFAHGVLAVSSENKVFIIPQLGKQTSITDPWFSYIHTVQFHPKDHNRVLVSSSGFDLILEFDYKSKNRTFEWLAWEHGFNKASDPKTGKDLFLTRSKSEHEYNLKNGLQSELISDPFSQPLPTAKRAAFINSVTYKSDEGDKLLATFFHKGKVFEIDKNTGTASEKISGLNNPHGGHYSSKQLVATSTASGEVFIVKNGIQKIISFKDLGGKNSQLGTMEWIQNTISYGNILISIDSNRTSFLIIDHHIKKFDIIPYDSNWAVQDLVVGKPNEHQKNLLKRIK